MGLKSCLKRTKDKMADCSASRSSCRAGVPNMRRSQENGSSQAKNLTKFGFNTCGKKLRPNTVWRSLHVACFCRWIPGIGLLVAFHRAVILRRNNISSSASMRRNVCQKPHIYFQYF